MNIDDRLIDFNEIPKNIWENLDLGYYAADDMEYLTNELLRISPDECNQYQQACSELYKMYEQAAQHVIDRDLWRELGIPENAIEIIKISWQQRHRLMHLYGRFDIAGIIDGKQAKLIEFNADTATVMPETAIIQKQQFHTANIEGGAQFNNLVQGLSDRFRQALNANQGKSASMLMTDLGHEEDALNLEVLDEAAEAAGFEVEQSNLEYIHFSPDEGISMQINDEEFLQFDFWFKLIPWEWIAHEEPELLNILTEIVRKDLCVILNPAYTLIYQSKAIMKVLWDLFPNHPLLLKTAYSRGLFMGEDYVRKVIFGREGENVEVFNRNGDRLERNKGDFGHYPSVYQKFVELPKDEDGDIYQAGVYFTYKPVALSYRRRDGLIVDTDAEFIGHYIL